MIILRYSKSLRYFIILFIFWIFLIIHAIVGIFSDFKKFTYEESSYWAKIGYLSNTRDNKYLNLDDKELGEKIVADRFLNKNIVPDFIPKYTEYKNRMILNVFGHLFIGFTSGLVYLIVLIINGRKYEKNIRNKVQSLLLNNTDIVLPIPYRTAEARYNRMWMDLFDKIVNLELQHEQELNVVREELNNMSHQLRTPVMSLMLHRDILLNMDNLNDEEREFLNTDKKLLKNISWIIDYILKLAKLESGSVIMKPMPINIYNLLKSSIESFKTMAEFNGNTFEILIDNDYKIILDEAWTLEALKNYIKNAIEHAYPNTPIKIICRNNVGFIEIAVENEGDNIPEDEIPHLFKRYYRSSTNKNPNSVGIGLNLSKKIIELQGGQVGVENLYNGVSFRMVFLKEI